MGAPTKYRADMCDLVVKAGGYGKTVMMMAEYCGITEPTIYEYARIHPDFSKAFTRAKKLSLEYWYKLGEDKLESQHFKEKTFELLLRNKCALPELRRIKIKALANAKTHNEAAQAIIKEFGNGVISPVEADKAMDIIGKAAKIDEVTELRKSIEKYEKEAK